MPRNNRSKFKILLKTYILDYKVDRKVNIQKIVLKPVNEINLFVVLKYESSTIMLFVGIRHSMRDLLSDINNYA